MKYGNFKGGIGMCRFERIAVISSVEKISGLWVAVKILKVLQISYVLRVLKHALGMASDGIR